MILHLVRHAAVAADVRSICFGQRVDPPIAHQPPVAEVDAFRTLVPGRVVSSPARRARETASLLGAPCTVDPRWAERDFGVWEGRRWSDCWAEVPGAVLSSVDRYLAFTPHRAESYRDVLTRVSDAMQNIDTSTIVVTHAGTIRAALVCAGVAPEVTYATGVPHLSVTTLSRASAGGSWNRI